MAGHRGRVQGVFWSGRAPDLARTSTVSPGMLGDTGIADGTQRLAMRLPGRPSLVMLTVSNGYGIRSE